MPIATRRDLLAFAGALLAAPAAAQQPPRPDTVDVALTTPQGVIVLTLAVKQAPLTAGNLLRYVDRKLYDRATFYRASKPASALGDDDGLVQGGLRNDPKRVLPPIAHESTLQTGLSHTNGAISMARDGLGTAQADWFICVGDQPYLNADPKDPRANAGYAAFGHVTQGMELVRQILAMPTDPTKGTGSMKGEILKTPLPIITARRVAA